MDNKVAPGPDVPNEEGVSIQVGPIIGKTTTNTSRVLVELNKDATITAVLSNNDNDNIIECDESFKADWPKCFIFNNLIPGTTYNLSFRGITNSEDRVGTVRTFPEMIEQMNIVCAACDKTKNRGDVNLFQTLYEDFIHGGHVDLFIRHGDQVYADSAFDKGKVILKDTSLSDEEKHRKIIHEYQEIYRSTYNMKYVRLCMSNVQTLCMWDDHEIRNDWGSFSNDDNPNSIQYKIALAGRDAYWLYQRQLHEDVEVYIERKEIAKSDFHMHKWGQIGVMFVDNRGGRSFYSDTNPDSPNYTTEPQVNTEFLGSYQSNILHLSLRKDGYFNDVKTLIIVQTIPLTNFATCTSSLVACCCKPQVDKMGWGLFPEEQCQWIDSIDSWKRNMNNVSMNNDETKSDRNVLLVGGDMHFGSETMIYNSSDNRPIIKQIVTSAISNKPPQNSIYYLLNRCCTLDICCCLLGGMFSTKHTGFIPQQNFLVVKADENEISSKFITGPRHCCNKRCC